MRYSLLAISVLFLGSISGCVWPPDSTLVGINQPYYPNDAGFVVHRVSERSLVGVESIVTTISPYTLVNYSPYYPDSVHYIIVNGDTAYRHPIITLPPIYDSAVPYHVDGSANFVTLAYSSLSITDTSYENGLTVQITSPNFGDTIPRSTDALIRYNIANSGTANFQSASVTLTDSINSYTQPIDYVYSNSVDFPSNDLATFQTGTLWVHLNLIEAANDNVSYPNYYGEYYYMQRQVNFDRVVAYPLH